MEWIIAFIGLGIMIVSIHFVKERAFIKALVLFVLGLTTLSVLHFAFVDSTENDVEEQVADEEPAETGNPVQPVDWSPLILGLGSLLTVGAVSAGGFLTYKGVSAGKKSRRRKEEEIRKQEEKIRSWDNLRNFHKRIISSYADYETDIWKALKYPALHDVNIEETSEFLKQMRVVENVLKDQENSAMGAIGGTEELYDKLSGHINTLSDLFEIAEKNALKMQWKSLPADEAKDLKRATQLLKHAENEGNSSFARQTYYEQLQKVVDRLNARHIHDIVPVAAYKSLASGDNEKMLLTDGKDYQDIKVSDLLDDPEEGNEKKVFYGDFSKGAFRRA